MKFLIIDPNDARFKDFQEMLEETDLADSSSVLSARNIAEAFEVIEKSEVEFIFANCSATRNSTAQIRQLRMAASTVPIVALISQGQRKIASDFIRSGADDHVIYADLNKSLLTRVFRYVMNSRQALHGKAELFANLSHEMRNPLHMILGTADLLAETDLNTHQKKLLHTFFISSRRLLTLLNTAFDIGQSEFKGADNSYLFERTDIKEFSKLLYRPFTQGRLMDFFDPLLLKPSKGAFEDKALEILVVDDDLENQKLIEAFVEKTKFKVTYASDGYEALDKAKNKHFDLILMDIEMPGLSGYETAEMLKPLQMAGKGKILGLSAKALPTDVIRAKKLGFAGYLTKPISKPALLSSIAGCLRSDVFYEPSKKSPKSFQ